MKHSTTREGSIRAPTTSCSATRGWASTRAELDAEMRRRIARLQAGRFVASAERTGWTRWGRPSTGDDRKFVSEDAGGRELSDQERRPHLHLGGPTSEFDGVGTRPTPPTPSAYGVHQDRAEQDPHRMSERGPMVGGAAAAGRSKWRARSINARRQVLCGKSWPCRAALAGRHARTRRGYRPSRVAPRSDRVTLFSRAAVTPTSASPRGMPFFLLPEGAGAFRRRAGKALKGSLPPTTDHLVCAFPWGMHGGKNSADDSPLPRGAGRRAARGGLGRRVRRGDIGPNCATCRGEFSETPFPDRVEQSRGSPGQRRRPDSRRGGFGYDRRNPLAAPSSADPCRPPELSCVGTTAEGGARPKWFSSTAPTATSSPRPACPTT